MLKYSMSAIFIASSFTIILLKLFNELDAGVVFIASFAAAYIINYWFTRSEGRTPTKQEQFKIVSIYGSVMFILYVGQFYFTESWTFQGLIAYTIFGIAYPASMQIILKGKEKQDT